MLASSIAAATLLGVVAHYGADQYESVNANEIQTVEWFYDHVPAGASVFTVCVNLPWRYEGAASYQYHSLEEAAYEHPLQELNRLVTPKYGAYFIATPSQATCGTQMLGLPANWLSTLEAGLERTGHVVVIYQNHGARIYHIVPHQSPTKTGGSS